MRGDFITEMTHFLNTFKAIPSGMMLMSTGGSMRAIAAEAMWKLVNRVPISVSECSAMFHWDYEHTGPATQLPHHRYYANTYMPGAPRQPTPLAPDTTTPSSAAARRRRRGIVESDDDAADLIFVDPLPAAERTQRMSAEPTSLGSRFDMAGTAASTSGTAASTSGTSAHATGWERIQTLLAARPVQQPLQSSSSNAPPLPPYLPLAHEAARAVAHLFPEQPTTQPSAQHHMRPRTTTRGGGRSVPGKRARTCSFIDDSAYDAHVSDLEEDEDDGDGDISDLINDEEEESDHESDNP